MSGQMYRKPSPEQMRKIRELSGELLDHPDRLFDEIPEPESSAEASLMLGALHKVRNQLTPIAGAETTMVSMIEDIRDAEYDSPPAPKQDPVDERLEEETDDGDEHVEELQRTCLECGETKTITEFRAWARGYRKECIPCESDEDASESDESNPGTPAPETDEDAELADAVQKIGDSLRGDVEPIRQLVEDTRSWIERKEGLIERGRSEAFDEQLQRYLDLLYELADKATATYERDPLLNRIERIIGIEQPA